MPSSAPLEQLLRLPDLDLATASADRNRHEIAIQRSIDDSVTARRDARPAAALSRDLPFAFAVWKRGQEHFVASYLARDVRHEPAVGRDAGKSRTEMRLTEAASL